MKHEKLDFGSPAKKDATITTQVKKADNKFLLKMKTQKEQKQQNAGIE